MVATVEDEAASAAVVALVVAVVVVAAASDSDGTAEADAPCTVHASSQETTQAGSVLQPESVAPDPP